MGFRDRGQATPTPHQLQCLGKRRLPRKKSYGAVAVKIKLALGLTASETRTTSRAVGRRASFRPRRLALGPNAARRERARPAGSLSLVVVRWTLANQETCTMTPIVLITGRYQLGNDAGLFQDALYVGFAL
jgi:hypothetical protein